MEHHWRKRVARLASNILNPFLVSLAMLSLLSFESTNSPLEGLKWLSISIAFSVLPVLIVTASLVRSHKLDSIFIYARRQRNRIYLLAAVCTAAGCAVLNFLGAPLVLVAAFVAGLLTVVAFMGINLMWKISVHTAFVAASVTILTIMYGAAISLTAVLVPAIAWARLEMEHHSLAQVVGGAILASFIAVVVFYSFGLLNLTSLV